MTPEQVALREDLPGETWRPIPGYEGLYEVSDLGRVYSIRRPRSGRSGRIKRAVRRPSGHLAVTLSREGRNATPDVHLLVMLAFAGPRLEGLEVRHLDGDPTNNRVCNLRYGTRSENVQDSVRHGTNPLAARSHCSQGHEFTEANTYRAPSKPNTRDCRECHRIYGRASKRQRRREAVA